MGTKQLSVELLPTRSLAFSDVVCADHTPFSRLQSFTRWPATIAHRSVRTASVTLSTISSLDVFLQCFFTLFLVQKGHAK